MVILKLKEGLDSIKARLILRDYHVPFEAFVVSDLSTQGEDEKVALEEEDEYEPTPMAKLKAATTPNIIREMVKPTMSDNGQVQAVEPENMDKVDQIDKTIPFVKAQISTKNQMILRNILAIISSVAVVVTFILEKLGIL